MGRGGKRQKLLHVLEVPEKYSINQFINKHMGEISVTVNAAFAM